MAVISSLQRAREARGRLKAVDTKYRTALGFAHARFNKALNQALKKHGLTLVKMSDYLKLPLAVHDELKDARKALVAERAAAQQAKKATVSVRKKY